MLHLSNKNVSSTYREIRDETFDYIPYPVSITYRNTNDISIMNAGLMPYIVYTPIKYLLFRFGFDVSYIFNDNTKHLFEILDRRKTLPDGSINDVYIPHERDTTRKLYSRVLQDESIKDLNKLQYSFVPSIGANIYFTDKFLFSPSFSYFVPLTDISKTNNYRIHSWRLNFEFRYNLAKSYKIYEGSTKKKPVIINRPK
jgi:hypothetical protein